MREAGREVEEKRGREKGRRREAGRESNSRDNEPSL